MKTIFARGKTDRTALAVSILVGAVLVAAGILGIPFSEHSFGAAYPPVILTFTANPNPVGMDGSFTLSWSLNYMSSGDGDRTLNLLDSNGNVILPQSRASGDTTPFVSSYTVAAGLSQPGSYTYTLQATNFGGTFSTSQTVIVQVNSGPSCSPAVLNFSYTQGGAAPAPQSYTLSDPNFPNTSVCIGGYNSVVNSTSPSTSGSGGCLKSPTTVSVSVNPNLTAGTWSTVISNNETGGSGLSCGVQVNVTVSPAPGVTCNSAGNPAPQTVTLTNSGSGTLNWTASVNKSWMTITSQTSGSLAAGQSIPLSVSFDKTGLTAGTYSGSLTVSGNAPTQSIPVTFTLN